MRLAFVLTLLSVFVVSVPTGEASELLFNRGQSTIELKSKEGKSIGTWEAKNNVVKTAKPFPDGSWAFDYHKAHKDDGPNSAYGSHGIFVFKVPGRTGLGVHSGRANAKNNPGPAHPTIGCIRTTDAAMQEILKQHK